MDKDIVVFSTVAKDHDLAANSGQRWRPLVELMRVPDFPVRRLYYFVPPSLAGRAEALARELRGVAPGAAVTPVPMPQRRDFSPATLGEVYARFDAWFERHVFDLEREDCYFHFGPGNLFAHAFMLTMLINIRHLPCRIVQLRSPQDGGRPGVEIYDGAISRWIAEIGVRERDRGNALAFLKSSIATENPAFNALIHDIEHVAAHSTAPMLLSGPTGSGKSQLARRIYELRRKRGLVAGRFVDVNCATLRGESALSTLFGHVRGAFTGAVAARRGLLAQADRGILFLDEIGELSPDMQVLLLKAIEEKEFLPFGADEPARSDFQLIGATNRDLDREIREGRFRLDLLSRLNLWHFHLPSLRERPEDIEPNIDYELRRLTAQRGVFAKFTPEARRLYLDFARSDRALWPGNFRDLAGSLERMLTYAFHGVVDEAVVRAETARLAAQWACLDASRFPLLERLAPDRADGLDLFDKVQLEEVLRVCLASPTRSEAGRILFARSRQGRQRPDDTSRLNKYLRAHGLAWEHIRDREA